MFLLQLQLPLICLTGFLLSGICRGEHLVNIQEGPLYRVNGYPASISCSVSGYDGQADQGFAFSVYKADKPDSEIRMISTFDQNYAYSTYFQRVRNKGLVIERLSKTSVILHFTSLTADDTGNYECYTPNQFHTYSGTYYAKTLINVIEDTLKASYTGPPSHSLSEGESLQLECEVSSQTLQHTHLSVTWYLQGSVDNLRIITLDRDLTVRPGDARFEDRYRSGLISIEKIEDTTYRLKMRSVQQSSSGEIYCQAEEWIQDLDRSWIRIAHKNTTASHVEIKALEIAEVGSFITVIDVPGGSLQEGQKVEIRCSVQAENLPGRFYSITWLRNNAELAQIGPTGVLTVVNDYKERQNEGDFRAVKISENVYVLSIRSVRFGDQGQYQCKAIQEDRTETGDFIRGKSQVSSVKNVSITAKESGLSVVMAKQQSQVTEGETLKILCNVSGASGPLSVSWQHKKSSGSSFRDVISLSREGVMVDVGSQYQQRSVRAFRSNSASLVLEISEAIQSDSGLYRCSVTEWNVDSSGVMKDVNRQSQQLDFTVNTIDSLLKVVLRSRNAEVTENSVIALICAVTGPKVPLAIHWKFQANTSAVQQDVICMLRNGAISCAGDQKNYQLEAQEHESGTKFTLNILKASVRHNGLFLCQISAYQGAAQKAEKLSYQLMVTVHKPVSRLSVSMRPKSLDVSVKSNAKIDCLIRGAFNSSRFSITWMFETQKLISMSPEGVVTLGSDPRINMQMTERQTFQLTVQQVRSTDKGQYSCSVEEWIQDPDGVWYLLNTTSASMELVVNEKASEFSLEKPVAQLEVTEGEPVDLSCSLRPEGLDSTFLYSLTWFFERQNQPAVSLLTYSHDGLLDVSVPDPELKHRLYFSRPKINTFHLSILRSVWSDSGRYRCQVDQHQLDCKGKWEWKTGGKSDFTNVSVRFIESKLQVRKENSSLRITDRHAGFTVECEIISRSSEKSHFEVTWSKSQTDGPPMTIFTARRDGTVHRAMSDKGLLYSRPYKTLYRLTVQDVEAPDSGQYHCHVVEWLQTGTDAWRKVAEDKSGELSIHVESEEKQSTGTFTLEITPPNLIIEGKKFELSCSIRVDKVDPKLQYSITWSKDDKKTRTLLVRHSHDGRLEYQSEEEQLNRRLQISRPSTDTFHLTVLNSVQNDSGRYHCEVQQHQFNCEGNWEKKGASQRASTEVTVQLIEKKLEVKKESLSLNVTDRRAGFTIECEISSQSSDQSKFKVSWSKSQTEGSAVTIFTANLDGTVYKTVSDRRLMFLRLSLNLFTLTVSDAVPSDDGVYQCHVEEWLNGVRKVAEDKSGELLIHVLPEAVIAEKVCSSGTILGISIPLLLLLLVVIGLLLMTVQKTKAASKKQKNGLWAENNPLKPVAEGNSD